MKKVPFDIEYYKKHKPQLVTRDGDKAALLAFNDKHPVLPLSVDNGSSAYFTNASGWFLGIAGFDHKLDILMLIPSWKFWLLKCRVNLFSLLMLIPFLVLIYLTISLFNDPKYDQGSLIFGVIYGLVWLYMFTIIRYLWKGK